MLSSPQTCKCSFQLTTAGFPGLQLKILHINYCSLSYCTQERAATRQLYSQHFFKMPLTFIGYISVKINKSAVVINRLPLSCRKQLCRASSLVLLFLLDRRMLFSRFRHHQRLRANKTSWRGLTHRSTSGFSGDGCLLSFPRVFALISLTQ